MIVSSIIARLIPVLLCIRTGAYGMATVVVFDGLLSPPDEPTLVT